MAGIYAVRESAARFQRDQTGAGTDMLKCDKNAINSITLSLSVSDFMPGRDFITIPNTHYPRRLYTHD